MDHSRHHGSTDERSRNTVNTYYARDLPDITSQNHYYSHPTGATLPPPLPPTRNLSSSRTLPCDCTTTPSGSNITCNGCRLNPPEDMWPPASSSSSNPANEHQRAHIGEYRHIANSDTSVRTAIRQSPMYVQQQQQQLQTQHQPIPPSQQQQQQPHLQQHHQQPPPPHLMQHGPQQPSQSMVQVHPSQVGSRPNSYWHQNHASNAQHYGEEHMAGPQPPTAQPATQTQIDISITRRSSLPTSGGPMDAGMYGQYKSASITATATHPSHATNSYATQPSATASSNLLHQRGVSAISGQPVASSVAQGSSHYITKERIYEHTKYSSSTTTTTKIAYNSTTSSVSPYESQHYHHQMNNNPSIVQSKISLPPIDHHVINPSNLPASKEQHPSPNYARKCPQMYTPEAEQTNAHHHHHLYMPTPQFSSEKFARASPQQTPPDFTKLRESPLQSSASSTATGGPFVTDKYNHVTPASHLRESPSQFVQQTSVSRSSNSYYNTQQNLHPSKVHPPEMSPIILKQSHAPHYQYSTKNSLPAPQMPPSVVTHQIPHQIPPGSKPNSAVLAPPVNPPAPPQQRYIIENVKREDLEIYENPSRNVPGSGIYINPYNTPPPTVDACCKDVGPPSACSSPYTTRSVTPNYRVESPQFYPTKYSKLSMATDTSNKHAIVQQNTPPPSRAPSQRGGHQQPAYYYEGNSHSAPSPAAATAASPSPSAFLTSTTTMSQTQMLHTEYVAGSVPNSQSHSVNQAYPPLLPSAQHQATTGAHRPPELMVSAQHHHAYERVLPHHPHQMQQHVSKHPGVQSNSGLQIQPITGVHHASKLAPATNNATTSKQHKPNYRELINRTLAIRSATSEEELNMQIIKKTLNVDTPAVRGSTVPNSQLVRGGPALPPQLLSETLRPETVSSQVVASVKPAVVGSSVLVTHNESTITLPRHDPPIRLNIKQENDKPSSSSSSKHLQTPLTTSSSPLDLSMRTVKTKADSTEYKYNQQQQQRRSTPNSSNEGGGRYILPRVDSTPVFSVHAFEPASNDISTAVSVRQNSRHSSLERRNYTPPTGPVASNSYHPQSSSSYVNAGAIQNQYHSQRRTEVQSTALGQPPNVATSSIHIKGCYETSCVIKTAPKSTTASKNSMPQERPSVLETNPYASVIKTEPKRVVETVTAAASSTQQHALAAVDRLPPDTSIMALPPKNMYPAQRGITETIPRSPAINVESILKTPQGCEKNPNFRKRHIQEYSNQMLEREPAAKQSRLVECPPVVTSKTIHIPMRPADISVIAVNEANLHEIERLTKAKQPLEVQVSQCSGSSVIASISAVQPAKVIVNNVQHQPPMISASLVVCKQEPLTPTGEVTTKTEVAVPVPPNPVPAAAVQMAASRIRTKAELKGFTFNPPPPVQTQSDDSKHATPPPAPAPPPPPPLPPTSISIKKEEELQIVKVKVEETDNNVVLPTIEGLDDEFVEDKLLDLGWSSTCNNFVEQLLTRPAKKKVFPVAVATNVIKDTSDKIATASTDIKPVENNLPIDTTALKKPLEYNFSNMESADNTRSSFNRFDGLESGMTMKSSMNQDSRTSPTSSLTPKKLTKLEREKKRFQQEKRLAERLQAKGSSSESEDELDKRKTERLKKPLMKAKIKMKAVKESSDENSSSGQGADKGQRFTDCGYDSSSATEAGTTKSMPNLKREKINDKEPLANDSKKDKADNSEKSKTKKVVEQKPLTKDRNVKSNTFAKDEKPATDGKGAKQQVKKDKIQKSCASSSTSESSEEEEERTTNNKQKNVIKFPKSASVVATKQLNVSGKSKFKVGLNTMTRSKLKKELELQLANSKVLRNDKIIRNSSTTKLRRKYVRKYVNNGNSFLESEGLSRESGIIKSTRLKAKLERKGGNTTLALLKKGSKCNKTGINKGDTGKTVKNENEHDSNVLELYRFKRALKVPPSLISIKHTGSHKIAASLPDLQRHAEALDAYAEKKKKSKSLHKEKNDKLTKVLEKSKNEGNLDGDGPRSIIDVLHSRVIKSSGLNLRNKTTTTTASNTPASKGCAANKIATSSSFKTCSGNNCGMFSETSQTTESSELQMLPPLKQDSVDEEEEDDNESANGGAGKKRHFSIFDTTVLPTKTRTESKMQQKRENIREIFVGDDRPASAPPEMIQAPTNGGEKMTYEQKYEQFLQQMNIVISADKFGRFGRSATARKLTTPMDHQSSTLSSIKQEEFDTESTSVMDPDEPTEDHKSECLVNQLRKKRGKYLRRKGSSGFDYIRKKKKPTSSVTGSVNNSLNNPNCLQFSIKTEKMEVDEYENKMKTEDDVSREIQKWVLNKGVGQSTMHKAARQGYIDVIVYCLDRLGMNPDQKDNAGYTPLHEACTNGWLEIALILLEYGANHSAAAHSGIRPLHEASENDNEEIVRLLLAYGADPLVATYSGQTPLMLASSTTMRDILSNHLIDVQSMGPERRPWKFNGPWEIYDPNECGYNVFEGAPNSLCDMSRALLRKGSLANNQLLQNKKLQHVLTNNTTATKANPTGSNINQIAATTTTTNNSANTACNQNSQNGPTITSFSSSSTSSSISSSSGVSSSGSTSFYNSAIAVKDIEILTPHQQQTTTTTTTTTKTVMDKCAVVLDKIDRFNAVRMNNESKPEILVENSDSDGEMFEFEEADILLPPLYLLKDEGTNDKWVLLSDLCNLLKVKSKDTLLNKIYPSTSSSVATATAHKSLMRELKMSDFLEKATCLQLLCAGEKLNICASKVVLIKYNENVRNLLGVKTILMKF